MDDIDRDSPLFEGNLPCKVQRYVAAAPSPSSLHSSAPTTSGLPAETKIMDLTVRLFSGTQTKAVGSRVSILYLEICDSSDPSFLHIWCCSEAEYAVMASEQSLLLPFPSFPSLLSSLLSAVRGPNATTTPIQMPMSMPMHGIHTGQSGASGSQGAGHAVQGFGGNEETMAVNRFAAVLSVREGVSSSIFAITETNAFKQMTHLTLATRPANDASIKKYLAARMQYWQQAAQKAGGQAAELAAEVARLREANDAGMAEISRSSADNAARIAQLQLSHANEVAQVKDRMAAEAAESEAAYRQQATETASRYEATVSDLRQRLEGAQQTVAALSNDRTQLENKLRELQSALGSASSDASLGHSEVGRLRATLAESEATRLQQAKEITAASTRIAVLEQSLGDKGELLDRTNALLAAAEEAKRGSEESLALYKATCSKQQAKLEAAVAEIHRGNGIIARLQEECRAAKSKSKAKSDAIKTLEGTLHEKASSIDAVQRDISALRADLQRERAAKEGAESIVASLKAQLAEARDALASNQQVIAWLNKELNDVHSVPQTRHLMSSLGASFSPSSPVVPAVPPSSIPRFRGSSTIGHATTSPPSAMDSITSTSSPKHTIAAPDKAGSPSLPLSHSSSPGTAMKTPPKPSPSASILLAKDSNPYLQPLLQKPAGGSPGTTMTMPTSSVSAKAPSSKPVEGYGSTAPLITT